jgi:peptidoglycan/LPS O-acetylase OafA/YrhL
VFIYAFSEIYCFLIGGYDDLVIKLFPAQLRFFVVGIGIHLYFTHEIIEKNWLKYGLVAIILFMLCNYYNELHLSLIYPLLVGALVYICAFNLPQIPLKYDISYGAYLIHAPLIQLSLLFGLFEDSTRFLFMLLVVVYVLAFCAEKFVELPMVRLGKTLSKKYEK